MIVRNAVDNQEIGESRIELDELIDTNLRDLAKEYCVCLNRSHILEAIYKSRTEKSGKGSSKEEKEKIHKEMSMFSKFSGMVRFQTLFLPTKDTSLRFAQLRDITDFTSPVQLLHFEYLMAKSDFDDFKFKIPQVAYNPNARGLGENMVDLPSLRQQCSSNPEIQQLLIWVESQGRAGSSEKQGEAGAIHGPAISDNIIKQIDKQIAFQSPFEKLYIILKLQRRQRPLIEPVFFNFKNIWDIYTQIVKNDAFNSLNCNEWFSFIDQISDKINFEVLDEALEQAEARAASEADKSGVSRSVSFVGEMVNQMNQRAKTIKRNSVMMAKQWEHSQPSEKNYFSLVLCKEWEKEGSQTFIDLAELIKCGVPSMLRQVVWSDLMKTSLIMIEEKKHMLSNYPHKYIRTLSVFENYQDISAKYDSIAFRQVDQDISDFKFPAYYFEESVDQSTNVNSPVYNNMPQSEGAVSKLNKLKHDKQLMRKLLRLLLVWGKTFVYKKVKYQFCYTTGFLKLAHRFINLMSVEDAFWILIGFIRQYPRLWCVQESAMLDDAKSNFRFELTCFKAILELNFPKVATKLYQLGLSVETLVYDSMTSLYSDFFHSETLLRIWDQMMFYFHTTDQASKRRGTWLVLAPALLVISVQREAILRAQTAKEAMDAYSEGCGLSYNPNEVIDKLEQLIEEIFVTNKTRSESTAAGPTLGESGGTGTGMTEKQASSSKGPSRGFWSIFGKSNAAPISLDVVRKDFQRQQEIVFADSRARTRVVHDFLFVENKHREGSEAADQGRTPAQNENRGARGARQESDDDMDFDKEDGDDDDGVGGAKPASHSSLDYRRWRADILPAIQNRFLMTETIVDDDLHEFEDQDIYQKTHLDIKAIHIYLHNLDNWHGTGEADTDAFRLQI